MRYIPSSHDFENVLTAIVDDDEEDQDLFWGRSVVDQNRVDGKVNRNAQPWGLPQPHSSPTLMPWGVTREGISSLVKQTADEPWGDVGVGSGTAGGGVDEWVGNGIGVGRGADLQQGLCKERR